MLKRALYLSLLLTLGWAVLSQGITSPAKAQEEDASSMGILAIVNDEVITSDDLEQRLRIAFSFSGLENSAEVRKRLLPQLLQRLVDEVLQTQEAERRRLNVTDTELDNAFAKMREQFQLDDEKLNILLTQRGIRKESLLNQLRAEVAWSKLLFQRLRPRIVVNDNEIDEAIEAISGEKGVEEWQLSDILLPVDSPDNEDNARRLAEKLIKEVRSGASFEKLATQFPALKEQNGTVAPRWVGPQQLDTIMLSAVRNLDRGEISRPIRTAGGYHILKLHDVRNLLTAHVDQSEVSLRQIIIPLEASVPAEEINQRLSEAERLGYSIVGCQDFREKTERVEDARYQDLGRVQIKQLHEEVRKIVRDLPVGAVSKPIRTPLGIHLMIICERINAHATIIDRDKIRERLVEKKLSLEALRLMNTLRREAFVELRR